MWPPRIRADEKSCINCAWFMFADRRDKFGKPVKFNRECCYDGPITTKRGVCEMWKDTRTLKQKLIGIKVTKGFC